MTGEESLNDPFLIENDFVKKLGNDIPVLDKSFEKLSFESSTVVKIIGDDLQILRKGKLSDEIMTQYRMKVENF